MKAWYLIFMLLSMPSCVDTACLVGQYTYWSGSANVCGNCGSGTVTNTTTATSCTSCPAGSAQQSTGQSACVGCAIGKYQPNTGQMVCISCPVRTYNNLASQASAAACQFCSPGTYNALAAQSVCKTCGPGTYNPAWGQSMCTACSAGQVQTGIGKTACDNCPVGQYVDTTGSLTCQACPIGSYADKNGTITCPLCPPGTINLVTGASICDFCEMGKYLDTYGNTVCKLCPVGTANSGTGKGSLTDCLACPLNTYQDFTGQSTCKNCASGLFSTTGSPICMNCPTLGTYITTQWCVYCSKGKYQDQPNQPLCKLCNAGQYVNIPGATACVSCADGYYQDNTGKTVCKNCSECASAGMFKLKKCVANMDQQCAACSVCSGETPAIQACTNTSDAVCGSVGSCGSTVWRGKTSIPSWLTDEYRCQAGAYLWGFDSALQVKSTCRPCPVGFVGLNGVFCERCGPLEEPYYVDRSVCVCKTPAVMNASGVCVCPDGFKTEGGGCVKCGADTWGQGGVCLPCAAGTTTPSEGGATVCDSCPFGQFRLVGQTKCQTCTTGWFAALANSSACTACYNSCPVTGWRRSGACPGDTSYSLCVECTEGRGDGLPPGNATWANQTIDPTTKLTLQECAYDCVSGFYKDNAGGEACKPCNQTLACDAGWSLTACTEWADSHCEVPCVDETKPRIYSHWVSGNGCVWACDPGTSLSMTDYVMFTLYECNFA